MELNTASKIHEFAIYGIYREVREVLCDKKSYSQPEVDKARDLMRDAAHLEELAIGLLEKGDESFFGELRMPVNHTIAVLAKSASVCWQYAGDYDKAISIATKYLNYSDAPAIREDLERTLFEARVFDKFKNRRKVIQVQQ